MKATEALLREHDLIRAGIRVLDDLTGRVEENATVAVVTVSALLDFFERFALRCHVGKEEEILLPALDGSVARADGSRVEILEREHRLASTFLETMRATLPGLETSSGARLRFARAARSYATLVTNHMLKEDEFLRDTVAPALGEERDAALAGSFDRFDAETLGPGGRAAVREEIAALVRATLGFETL